MKRALLAILLLLVLVGASPRPREVQPACYHGLLGDMNNDGWVNAVDYSILNAAWHTQRGDAAFDRRADLTCDGKVDEDDFAVLQLMYWKRR